MPSKVQSKMSIFTSKPELIYCLTLVFNLLFYIMAATLWECMNISGNYFLVTSLHSQAVTKNFFFYLQSQILLGPCIWCINRVTTYHVRRMQFIVYSIFTKLNWAWNKTKLRKESKNISYTNFHITDGLPTYSKIRHFYLNWNTDPWCLLCVYIFKEFGDHSAPQIPLFCSS